MLATLAAYAVFGTSRHLIAAATSAAAVLLASSVGGLAGTDAARYMSDAAGLVIFCGGLFLIAGLLRLGFVAQFLSRPVMEGFVFGLAIFVTVSQLPKLFGIEKGSGDTIKQFIHLIGHLGDTSGATLAVGAGALVLLFAAERLAPKIPGGLLALVLGILVSTVFSLSAHGVKIVGHVPSGLPTPGVPSIHSSDVLSLITAAAGLLLVIFSESLGAADNFATKYGYEIDPNQELIALGVANAGSGLLGGLAGGGSLSQSAVNEGAGARSEISPLIAAVLILITVLVLTPLFKNLPEAVLAALIIHAVSHLWKFAEMRRYYNLQRLEFWLALATLLGVINDRRTPRPRDRRRRDAAACHLPRQQTADRIARAGPRRARRLWRDRQASRLRPHPRPARAPARGPAVLRQRHSRSRPCQDARRHGRPADERAHHRPRQQ